MDKWSIIALFIAIPAILFLVTVAAISSARMSRHEIRVLLLFGLLSIPVVVICRWPGVQEGLVSPFKSIVDIIGGTAGFVVIYALIATITLLVRRTQGGARRRR